MSIPQTEVDEPHSIHPENADFKNTLKEKAVLYFPGNLIFICKIAMKKKSTKRVRDIGKKLIKSLLNNSEFSLEVVIWNRTSEKTLLMRSFPFIRLPWLIKGKQPVLAGSSPGHLPSERVGSASGNLHGSAGLVKSSPCRSCVCVAQHEAPGTSNTPLVSVLIQVLVLSGSCLFCPPAVSCLRRMLAAAGAAHATSAGKASSRAGCCFIGTLPLQPSKKLGWWSLQLKH